MKNKWQVLEPDKKKVNTLTKTLGISKIVATVLVNREIDGVEAASLFLQAKLKNLFDPFLLKDAQKAAKIIIDSIKKRRKIVIYGDYDVDGITSTLIMYEFLSLIGGKVAYYIPRRLEDGYGLNTDTLEEVVMNKGSLLVTVDCGISSIDEIKYGNRLGLETIIIDHHHVGDTVPDAVAVINPHQDDCKYPFEDMAAVGVVFTFLMVLKKEVEKDGFFKGSLPNLVEYLDVVAMGTVADMVPLLDSNRVFVKHGLIQMQKNNRPGLRALANVCGVKSLKEVTPSVISYKMAPRLNAAGRIGNAIKGLELILCNNYDVATKMAEELNLTNEFRQQLEAEIFDQANNTVQSEKRFQTSSTIVLHSTKWHPGVVGIVASRLVDKYYKPTIMISVEDGIGKGSARSISQLHIYSILEELKHYLIQYGGHKYAAGLTIKASNIHAFTEDFEKLVTKTLSREVYVQSTDIDAELSLAKLTPDMVVAFLKLEPFGMNNKEPNFLTRRVHILKQNIINRTHIHWKLGIKESRMPFHSIGFGLLNNHKKVPEVGDYIDIIYFPKINTYGGNINLQLFIKDFEISK